MKRQLKPLAEQLREIADRPSAIAPLKRVKWRIRRGRVTTRRPKIIRREAQL